MAFPINPGVTALNVFVDGWGKGCLGQPEEVVEASHGSVAISNVLTLQLLICMLPLPERQGSAILPAATNQSLRTTEPPKSSHTADYAIVRTRLQTHPRRRPSVDWRLPFSITTYADPRAGRLRPRLRGS